MEVFVLDIRYLPDPLEVPEVMSELSEKRKSKILNCKQVLKRKQSYGAGILLRQILERYDKSPDQIYYADNGKPLLDGIYFNLSHSGEKVVCAIGSEEVGIDIQKIRNLHVGFAERYFTKNENAYLDSIQDPVKKMLEINRIWTIKESYLKMTGEGLRIPLDQIEVVCEEPVKIYRDGKVCECYIKEYEIDEYKIAVCAKTTILGLSQQLKSGCLDEESLLIV